MKTIKDMVDNFSNYRERTAITNHYTYGEMQTKILQLASYLQKHYSKGDRGVILSENHPNIPLITWAMQYIGMVAVPIDPKERGKENTEFMISHSEPKIVFDNLSIDSLLKDREVESDVTPQDTASLFYTSGTTGKPSGVMLTHENLMHNAKGALDAVPMHREKFVSFLPLSHAYGNIESIIAATTESEVAYSDPKRLRSDFLKEQPTRLVTSPLLLKKILKHIDAKFPDYELLNTIKYKLAGKKVRKLFGGNIQSIFSGGSSLDAKTQKAFWQMGIDVRQGYGATETSPIATAPPKQKNPGSVGLPLPGVEAMTKDGELYIKGPCVMKGYFKDEKKTNEKVINGWYKTGDFAKIENGWIYITGRKNITFKLDNGKFVDPAQIENLLEKDPAINYAVVGGEGQKNPFVILYPEFEADYTSILKKRLQHVDPHMKPTKALIVNQNNEHFSIKKEPIRRKIIDHYNDSITTLYNTNKTLIDLYTPNVE